MRISLTELKEFLLIVACKFYANYLKIHIYLRLCFLEMLKPYILKFFLYIHTKLLPQCLILYSISRPTYIRGDNKILYNFPQTSKKGRDFNRWCFYADPLKKYIYIFHGDNNNNNIQYLLVLIAYYSFLREKADLTRRVMRGYYIAKRKRKKRKEKKEEMYMNVLNIKYINLP